MPFALRNQTHVPDVGPTLGTRTGFLDNFGAAWERQRKDDSAFGYEMDLFSAYKDNLDRAEELSREKLGFEELRELVFPPTTARGEQMLRDIDVTLSKWKKEFPEIKTLAELHSEHQATAQEIIDTHESVSARRTWGGLAGEFAGGFAGSVNMYRDPLYTASLLFGAGAARGVLSKLVIEASIGGSVEAAQQFLFVDPRYKREGLEGNNAWANVITAALGSAAFRGVLDGLGAGYRRLKGKPREQVKLAQEELGIDPEKVTGEVSDQEILDLVLDLPKTKEQEIAVVQLEQRIKENETSPYPNTREGHLEAEARIEVAAAELRNVEPSPQAKERVELADARESGPAEEIARTNKPELYKQLDEAEAQRKELAIRLTELEAAQQKLADYEDQLDRTSHPGEKKGLEWKVEGQRKKINEIKEGKPPKTREEIEADIAYTIDKRKGSTNPHQRGGLTKKLARLRKELKELPEEKPVQTKEELSAEDTRVREELRKLGGKIEGLKKPVIAEQRKILREIEKKNREAGVTPHMIEAAFVSDKTQDAYIAQLKPDENGDIDFGLEWKFNEEQLEGEFVDEAGKVHKMSAKQVLDEIKEDEIENIEITTCSGVKSS